MTTTSKLRVSVSDQADALEILRSEVEGATGFAVEPELQEAEHDELVVEMRFTGLVSPEPQLVARAVKRSTSGIDVLSSWNEQLPARDPAPAILDSLYRTTDATMPPAAWRAARDQLATAQWIAPTDTEVVSHRSCWQLAVPVLQADGQSLIGVQQRRGYARRFSTQDVAAGRLRLAS
jgi:hypothetical protein